MKIDIDNLCNLQKAVGQSKTEVFKQSRLHSKQIADYEKRIKNAFIAAGSKKIKSDDVIIEIDTYYKKRQ